MDFILNGQAHGSVAKRLLAVNGDVSVLRPWVGRKGRCYVAQFVRDPETGEVVRNKEGRAIEKAVFIGNDRATLRRDEWKWIDDEVVIAAKERLRLIADLRGAGLTLTVPGGMAKTMIETAVIGDITPATISMDPARKSEGDRPEYDFSLTPLPIIHKDFQFTLRQILVSRGSGTPLDSTMVRLAGQRVAEEAEKLAIGTSGTYTYGGGTIYGLTNFPTRGTQTLTSPEASAWTQQTTVEEILEMRQTAYDRHALGPYVLYVSKGWAQYLDLDYSDTKGDNTLRERILAIDGISEIRVLDHLADFQIVMLQLSSDTIRLAIGMDITTLQWETEGGMVQNFKVMAMMVPQIRADINDNNGLIHGAVAA